MIKALALAAGLVAGLATPLHSQQAADAVEPDPAPEVLDDPGPDPELVITEAGALELSEFLWVSRLLVVFGDSEFDPRFIQQMEYIRARPEDLIERDVVVITDTDPAARSPIREALRPRGFDLVLIGKDGLKYLRKPLPWDVREITRSIDKLPLRQQELNELRGKP